MERFLSDVVWLTLWNFFRFSRGKGTEEVGGSDNREEEDGTVV